MPQQFVTGIPDIVIKQTPPRDDLPVPVYAYVSTKYEVYDGAPAWQALGYLALFILAFQTLAFIGLRTVKHIVR